MVHDTFGKPDIIRFGNFGKMSLFISRFGLVGSVWHEGLFYRGTWVESYNQTGES